MSDPTAPIVVPDPTAGPERDGAPPPRIWLGRLGRTASAVLVLSATVALVVAGQRLPVARAGTVPDPEVSVPASATTLVCPGTVQLPELSGATDKQFDPVPVKPVTRLTAVTLGPTAGAGTVRGLDGAATGDVAAGGGSAQVRNVGSSATVRAQAGAGAATQVAAASTTLVTAGDLRGLSGSSCQAPGADVWLVGGATDGGGSAQLVLANPGSTPAEVSWQVWGPTGPVDLTGERALVAPGAQQVVNLAGVAGEQRALVVRVRATGGLVWAHVQADALDGFTPVGTDLVVGGSGPAKRQVLPGLLVAATAVGDAGQPMLRLLATDHDTTARLAVLGDAGPVDLPGADSVALSAGQVVDVPLGGIPAGRYTVVVDADQPVVAGASFARVGSGGDLDRVPRIDRALVAAVPGGGGLVAVPTGVDATLVVGAVAGGADPTVDGTGRGRVEVVDTSGAVLSTHDLSVDTGTTGAWSLSDLLGGTPRDRVAGLRVEPTGDAAITLAWALVLQVDQADGALVTVLEPTPTPVTSAGVAVREDPVLGLG